MIRVQKGRLRASVAVLALLLALGGCANAPSSSVAKSETTGSIAAAPQKPRTEAEWRREAETLAERYRAEPENADIAIAYSQALRGMGQRSQAVAVLEQASIHNPQNQTLLGHYGRALADVGNYTQALDVLARAHTPDQPDWRILSVQGAVLDQMGRNEEARNHYFSALRIAPNEPSVLSNLGLSYALSKDLTKAEETLRLAAAQPSAEPKVRQNLALVVGLQGRFAEAETIARGDLSPDEAAANVAYLRQMLLQQKDWKKPPARRPATPVAQQPVKTKALTLLD
jgi:Flp pilus assembly protein TadD